MTDALFYVVNCLFLEYMPRSEFVVVVLTAEKPTGGLPIRNSQGQPSRDVLQTSGRTVDNVSYDGRTEL